LLNEHDDGSTRQADEQQPPPPPTHIDPFTLKHASIGSTSNPQVKQGFIFDQKLPLGIPPEGAISGNNVESEPTGDSRNPSLDSASEDVSPRPGSSAANSLAPSTTPTARQERLQAEEQASASQLASLEARIGSAEWVHVSRAEYEASAAEMSRLRAEVAWLRDAQQSDWALGLSDEMPPPYSNARVEPGQ
jgi:hypothetical protein